MFVVFILGCLILGLVLAFVLAPIIVIQNASKLKEMRRIVSEFEALPQERREQSRMEYKRKLTEIKSQISAADKSATEKARDLISII